MVNFDRCPETQYKVVGLDVSKEVPRKSVRLQRSAFVAAGNDAVTAFSEGAAAAQADQSIASPEGEAMPALAVNGDATLADVGVAPDCIHARAGNIAEGPAALSNHSRAARAVACAFAAPGVYSCARFKSAVSTLSGNTIAAVARGSGCYGVPECRIQIERSGDAKRLRGGAVAVQSRISHGGARTTRRVYRERILAGGGNGDVPTGF